MSILSLNLLNPGEIRIQIDQMLPLGWRFLFEPQLDGTFDVQILGEEGNIEYFSQVPDEKIACLNAYGWLYSKNLQVVNPAWIRGRSIAERQNPSSKGVVFEDPGDLDPDEVESVYKNRNGDK